MKRLLINLCILFFFTSASLAQSNFNSGNIQINAGTGLSTWGIPLYIGADYFIFPDISAGAEVSYRTFNEHWAYYKYRHSVINLSAIANYHFNTLFDIDEEWDVYAGVNAGFYFLNSSSYYYGSHTSGVSAGVQLGGRYFFANNMAVNVELNGNNAYAASKFGITFKF